mgnify:CR=1 FL=1
MIVAFVVICLVILIAFFLVLSFIVFSVGCLIGNYFKSDLSEGEDCTRRLDVVDRILK